MDKNTFGKSPASERLVRILSEEGNKKYVSSVSELVGRFQQQTKAIMDIKDTGLRGAVLNEWRFLFIDKVKSYQFPIEIERFTLNVITMVYRKSSREIKGGGR